MDVKKGEFIGLDGKHLLVTETDRVAAAKALIRKVMEASHKDVIIFFYGQAVSQEEVAQLQEFLAAEYPLVDTGFVDGKQGVYDFIISLE